MIIILFCILVPTPNVTVTAPNTQTVGESLTLQCEVTTVRGITNRVDIVWSSGGDELQRMNTDSVTSTTMDNSLVYKDFYTISRLSTTDDGRMIKCTGEINSLPSVMASDSVKLNVVGKCDILMFSTIKCVELYDTACCLFIIIMLKRETDKK